MTSDPSLHTPRVPEKYKTRLLTGLAVLTAFCEAGGNRIPTQTAVVRTKLQKAIGGYRPDLPHSGDMEMWLRFALRAPVGVIDADQAYYRVHGSNMHIGYVSAAIGDMDQLRRTFEIVFHNNADLISVADRDRLYDIARRAVAMRAVRKASVAIEAGDHRGCSELLAFAKSTFPDVRSEKTWRRLRLKRLLGARLCSAVRPLLNRIRGVPSVRPTSMRIGLFPQM
jgi:hypothetical protein